MKTGAPPVLRRCPLTFGPGAGGHAHSELEEGLRFQQRQKRWGSLKSRFESKACRGARAPRVWRLTPPSTAVVRGEASRTTAGAALLPDRVFERGDRMISKLSPCPRCVPRPWEWERVAADRVRVAREKTN